MKKKITYTDEPKDVDLDNARIMEDFLPAPEELVLKKDRIVTLRLDDSTISDLKKIAAQKGLGVSSLVRMWVRERLNNKRDLHIPYSYQVGRGQKTGRTTEQEIKRGQRRYSSQIAASVP